jgi:hypothetical protein
MKRSGFAPQQLSRALGLVLMSAEAVAFWVTVAFPLFYVGGYVATQVVPELPSLLLLGGLLSVNTLVLVVGHRYDRNSGRGHEPSLVDRCGTS